MLALQRVMLLQLAIQLVQRKFPFRGVVRATFPVRDVVVLVTQPSRGVHGGVTLPSHDLILVTLSSRGVHDGDVLGTLPFHGVEVQVTCSSHGDVVQVTSTQKLKPKP